MRHAGVGRFGCPLCQVLRPGRPVCQVESRSSHQGLYWSHALRCGYHRECQHSCPLRLHLPAERPRAHRRARGPHGWRLQLGSGCRLHGKSHCCLLQSLIRPPRPPGGHLAQAQYGSQRLRCGGAGLCRRDRPGHCARPAAHRPLCSARYYFLVGRNVRGGRLSGPQRYQPRPRAQTVVPHLLLRPCSAAVMSEGLERQ